MTQKQLDRHITTSHYSARAGIELSNRKVSCLQAEGHLQILDNTQRSVLCLLDYIPKGRPAGNPERVKL